MKRYLYLKMLFVVLLIIFISGCTYFTPKTTWRKIHGYSGNEYVNDIIKTKDGNYILAGMSNSKNINGEDDFYFLKIDKWGNILWEIFFFGERDDNAQSVIETSDGGLLLLGESYSYATGISKDLFAIKYDAKGNLAWAKNFGGIDMDGGRQVIEDSDGNYIFVGWTRSFGQGNSDFYVLKLDPNGNLIWSKTWGGRNFDEASSVVEVEDGYLVLGYTMSFGNGSKDVVLVKFDKNGNVIWYKTYGGTKDDVGNRIEKTKDGNFILVGSTLSYSNYSDVYIIKVDPNGDMLWERYYGGDSGDEGECIRTTSDGGYIISGSTRSFGTTGTAVYLIRLDSDGNLLWQKVYDGDGDDDGKTIIETEDNGYILAGLTRSWGASLGDVLITKLNSQGDF